MMSVSLAFVGSKGFLNNSAPGDTSQRFIEHQPVAPTCQGLEGEVVAECATGVQRVTSLEGRESLATRWQSPRPTCPSWLEASGPW